MKKPNIIIGKKHIILSSLLLILGIAVYMNYAFASAGDAVSVDEDSITAGKTEVNYGDAEYVNADVNSIDYFSQARLSRMTSRDEAVETLSAMLNGGDISAEEDAAYTAEAVNLTQMSESESKIESLIKAQGFEDCVVYLDDDTANIVVRTNGLTEADAAKIKDVLLSEVTISAENIRIFEVK